MSEKTFPVPLCSTVEGMQWLYNTATDNFIRELRDANAELDALRAEVERLRKALRASTRELQYIAECDPCDKFHQSGEGRACVALAERILGPMYLWPDEPNLSAPAEEEGRDA